MARATTKTRARAAAKPKAPAKPKARATSSAKSKVKPKPPAPRAPFDGLLIHVGSPKTGSTALQNFLTANDAALSEKGVHFLKTGRRHISHNGLARDLRGRGADQIWARIADEVATHPGAMSLLSSEDYFSIPHANAFARDMPDDLRAKTRVLVYLRRQDAYLEAMYKQKTKNGRLHMTPRAFAEALGMELGDYGATVGAFGDAFGAENVEVRRFERASLKGGDILTDMLALYGLSDTDPAFQRPTQPVNQTLSRVVTEQMGALARNTKINVRELAREMVRDPNGIPRRSGDVFTRAERVQVMDMFAKTNAALMARFLPDQSGPLFDMSDLDGDAPDPYPTDAEALDLYAEAQEKIAAAIGRIEAQDRDRLFRG